VRRRPPEARTVGRRLAARDQHHPRRVRHGRQPFRDNESVDVWEPDVEQDYIRLQTLNGGERRGAVRGFADNGKPLRLEQGGCRLAEAVVIVDDEHGLPHVLIVAKVASGRIVADPDSAPAEVSCKHGAKTVAGRVSLLPRTA